MLVVDAEVKEPAFDAQVGSERWFKQVESAVRIDEEQGAGMYLRLIKDYQYNLNLRRSLGYQA